MGSVGHDLQEGRRQRGMSLDEAAARTRIRRTALEALENDDYATLTVEVTTKGFLRAYARCLDLDEREILTRYEQIVAERRRREVPQSPIGQTSRVSTPEWKTHLTLAGATLAVLAVVIAGVIAFTSTTTPPEHPAAISVQPAPQVTVPDALPNGEPIPSGTADVPPTSPSAPPSPEATMALNQPPNPPAAPAKNQRLMIAATETSWVHVTIDGEEQKEALLQPGERITWEAEREFRLTLGNAGGVRVVFNDQSLDALGSSGRVRTIVLPRASGNGRSGEPAALTSLPDLGTVPPLPLN